MARFVVVELERNSPKWTKVIDDIVRIEKKIFPKHESLARSFDEELKKRNTGLLFSEVDGDVAGYVMYSWPSSLCASITKLAGDEAHTADRHLHDPKELNLTKEAADAATDFTLLTTIFIIRDFDFPDWFTLIDAIFNL
ncbi:uncharacterized protein LOC130790470 isoform X4 [Actinidia eriantha]|uniref:uncharacterized protein LOC130790470 isoform X4 n=1 Tax=Actinidia eriantha TaxID=165200 RepID=UPI00259085E0|nr:uncharacterized protein LOC130790470 isoform X4 [Actinidia eriantha]